MRSRRRPSLRRWVEHSKPPRKKERNRRDRKDVAVTRDLSRAGSDGEGGRWSAGARAGLSADEGSRALQRIGAQRVRRPKAERCGRRQAWRLTDGRSRIRYLVSHQVIGKTREARAIGHHSY